MSYKGKTIGELYDEGKPISHDDARKAFESTEGGGPHEWLAFWMFARRAAPHVKSTIQLRKLVMNLIYEGFLMERSAPGRGSGTLVKLSPTFKEPSP